MAQSILIVDDDADTRSLLGASLTEQGFIVYAARNGRHALQILERISPPALILLDYNMPVMNGKQFLAVKRSDPRWQAIPVVVLSAWTREWTAARMDVVEVLPKPVDLERLLALVNRTVSAPQTPMAPPGMPDSSESMQSN
ncbi:MAG TPA: response regulator [Gemmatimonadales bacterium]|nr:response regulator [Gemmatimonadales bacterium]